MWFLAAASADVVLALPPDTPMRLGADTTLEVERQRDGGLWGDVLRLMGGEYALMAQAAIDTEDLQ